jgi:universal stress protein A
MRREEAQPIVSHRFASIELTTNKETTMEIQTILLPTDFSAYAERACQHGFTLAAREKAQVLLLHVLLRSDLAFGETPLPLREQLEQELRADAEQWLQRLAVAQTVPVEPLVVWGSPASEICRIAKERSVDLIVMATHGRTGLGHLFIGSVAERVVRHAPCSVLIVRVPRQN